MSLHVIGELGWALIRQLLPGTQVCQQMADGQTHKPAYFSHMQGCTAIDCDAKKPGHLSLYACACYRHALNCQLFMPV